MRNKQKSNYTNLELVAAILNPLQRKEAIHFVWNDKKVKRMSFAKIRKFIKDSALVWDVYDRSILAFVTNVEQRKFEGRSSWRTYLVGICHFKALKQLEQLKKHDMKKEEWTPKHEEIEQTASPEEALVDLETETEFKDLFEQLLDQVSKGCKEVLKSHYYEELKIKEIAAKTEKAEQSVKNALFNCRKKLRTVILQDPKAMQIIGARIQSWKEKKK